MESLFASGVDVILNVEVEGAAAIRKQGLGMHPAVLIFLAPSSLDHLEERLRARGTEVSDKIEERLDVAAREMVHVESFDYLVVNDDLDSAVSELRAIILAERLRIAERN